MPRTVALSRGEGTVGEVRMPSRVAVVTLSPLFPLSNGYRLRVHALVTCLAELVQELRVWSFHLPGEGPLAGPFPTRFLPLPAELPWQTALRYFRAAVTGRSPVAVRMLTGPVLACLERELATYRPEVVVLSGIHLVEAIPLAKRVGAGLVVVDLHNAESRLILEFLRVARLPRDVVHWAVFWWGTRCLEIRYLRAADELWAVSAQDAAALAPVAGKAEVVEVPNVVDTRWYDASCSTFDWLPGVLYVGRFDYPPNAVAARLLIERIHPEVTARVPGAVLYLVGRSPTPFMRAAARSDPSVVVTDEVPDTRPYLDRAAVVAVPLLQGGGTRLKILESLAAGKAVVSTPKGCEGLDVRDGEHLLIRHVGEFAEAIVGLLQDAPLRSRLGRAGRELVERRYSPAALRRILADRLARLG